VERKSGKDGLKTMLTGLITKLPRPTLDLHTTQPSSLSILLALDPLVLVCPSSVEPLEVRKNGKDGLKITLIGEANKLTLLMRDLLTTLPLSRLKNLSTSLVLMALVCPHYQVSSKARKSGKAGPKTTSTGLKNKPILLKPDSLTLPL